MLVIQNVICIERFRVQHFRLHEVPCRAEKPCITRRRHHENVELFPSLARRKKRPKRFREYLRFRLFNLKPIEHFHLSAGKLFGKRAHQRCTFHLLIDFLRIVALFDRSMSFAASHPQWRANGAVPGTPRSLLPPWFLSAASHFSSALSVRPGTPAVCELSKKHLLHKRRLPRHSEDALRKFRFANYFIRHIIKLRFHGIRLCGHQSRYFFLSSTFLISKSPPGAPGTAPFKRRIPFSESTPTTWMFLTVTRAEPICPAKTNSMKTKLND